MKRFDTPEHIYLYSIHLLQVRMAALPPLISLKVAESILFIGKAVRMLQASKSHLAGPPLLTQTDLAAFSDALQRLQASPTLNRTQLEHTIEDIRSTVSLFVSPNLV